jgi:hypothetical protein
VVDPAIQVRAGISARGDRSSGRNRLPGDRCGLDRGHGQDHPEGRLLRMVRATGPCSGREHHHVLRLRFFGLACAKRAPSVPPRRVRTGRIPGTVMAERVAFGLFARWSIRLRARARGLHSEHAAGLRVGRSEIPAFVMAGAPGNAGTARTWWLGFAAGRSAGNQRSRHHAGALATSTSAR